jgi:hypothetical protein
LSVQNHVIHDESSSSEVFTSEPSLSESEFSASTKSPSEPHPQCHPSTYINTQLPLYTSTTAELLLSQGNRTTLRP